VIRNFSGSRREALAALGAASIATALRPLCWAKGTTVRPPVARIEPVTEELWGDKVIDPYRWMENPNDVEWDSFMRGQAAYARSVLDAIPGRKRLYERIAQLSSDTVITRKVQSAGGRIFYEKRPRGADNYTLCMRQGVAGEDTVLVDPTVLKQNGQHMALDWWHAAPNGRYVAYALSLAGSESSVTHVLDVDAREILPERIDRTQYALPSWLPDSSGFFFNRLAAGVPQGSVDYYQNSVAWLHRLRTDPDHDMRVLARGQYPEISAETTDFRSCEPIRALTMC
jgi:prolyl oligopeptidase